MKPNPSCQTLNVTRELEHLQQWLNSLKSALNETMKPVQEVGIQRLNKRNACRIRSMGHSAQRPKEGTGGSTDFTPPWVTAAQLSATSA